YGSGHVSPFTGACDCPICNGSGYEGPIITTFPHANYGDPECCGCLTGIVRAREIHLTCNECGAVVRSAPVVGFQSTLDEIQLALGVCAEMCPHCRAVNLFPGFSIMRAYVCQKCGKAVEAGSSAKRQRLDLA